MATILPITDLKDYNKVLKKVGEGRPVFLTKEGRGEFVLINAADYKDDRQKAEEFLVEKLKRAEERETNGEKSYTMAEWEDKWQKKLAKYTT